MTLSSQMSGDVVFDFGNGDALTVRDTIYDPVSDDILVNTGLQSTIY